MKLMTKTIAISAGLSFLLYLYYSNLYKLLLAVQQNVKKMGNVQDNVLINTPGCTIPDYRRNFHFKIKKPSESCGERIVFVKKIGEREIILEIDKSKMGKLSKSNDYQCCYKFAHRSTIPRNEDNEITYTNCTKFDNGTKTLLQSEVLTVTCKEMKKKSVIYEDAYTYTVKKNISEGKTKPKWNVLLIGMDTMSRARVYDTMPVTVNFLQKNGWLDFKAYQKVGYNTYPNLMALLTGLPQDIIYSACPKSMDSCNEKMIWSRFRRHGYVTAYGEDNLSCPDTFKNYHGFVIPPTDHYMRPFFLTGETSKNYLICSKKVSSGQNLLNYAFDFATTYKSDSFFGVFWMNSFSHRVDSNPTHIDSHMAEFFQKLNDADILENTFVIFFSDHGIRFGPRRLLLQAYYEERLPMLFMGIPKHFREMSLYNNINPVINQNRLVSPYDVHLTLRDILSQSTETAESMTLEGCPSCSSVLREISPFRSCESVESSEKWCSCYNLVPVDAKRDPDVDKVIKTVVLFLNNKTKSIKTTKCTTCADMSLKSVIRMHLYDRRDLKRKYFVIAMTMSPANIIYEANVVVENNTVHIMQPTSTLTGYSGRKRCTIKVFDQEHCVCKTTCKIKGR